MRHPYEPDYSEPGGPKAGQCRGGSGRCDHGWVMVQPGYAERLYPDPPDLPLKATDVQRHAYEELVRTLASRRAAALDTWYPCQHCRAATFYRWAGGHLSSDHDPAACGECRTPRHRPA